MREVEVGYGSNESIGSGATRPGAAPLRRCSISKVAESSSISWRTTAVSFSNGEWASYPALVFLILDKLLEPIDHVRFAAVCKKWRSMSKLYNQATQRWHNKQLLPMLLIPNQDKNNDQRVLYSISEGRIYNNIQLEVPFRRRCSGSCHGWFATVDPTDQGVVTVTLRNPFTKANPIYLPPLNAHVSVFEPSYYEHYVPKVILSADPTLKPENYVVVALYRCWFELAFIKAGQNSWTYVNPAAISYGDVIFYKSQLYAVTALGAIGSLDVYGSDSNNPSQPPSIKLLTPRKPFWSYCFHAYLVESTQGDLLHILRYYVPKEGAYRFRNRQTLGFAVYKWVLNDEEDGGSTAHKVEVKSIGDEALFVGDNHSISVLASNFPGCQPNSIYYADDFLSTSPLSDGDEANDMGIFNLEDGTITQHYSVKTNTQRAIWVVPPFNGLC